MTTFENEIEIIEGTLDLEMARINRDYKYGLGMAVATESVCEYCMTEAADGQPGFFTRMIDAIVSFIRKINESVANLFSKQSTKKSTKRFWKVERSSRRFLLRLVSVTRQLQSFVMVALMS